MIDMSDYYILIVAGRYGSIVPEESISYTEKEYKYAVENDIPILTFLCNDLSKISACKMWKNDEEKVNIERFRNQLKEDRMVAFYSDIGDLTTKILSALSDAIKNSPRKGWVRADKVEETLNSPMLQDIKNQLDAISNAISIKIDEITPKYEFATDEDIDALFHNDK